MRKGCVARCDRAGGPPPQVELVRAKRTCVSDVDVLAVLRAPKQVGGFRSVQADPQLAGLGVSLQLQTGEVRFEGAEGVSAEA
jgi:hypothetical protein